MKVVVLVIALAITACIPAQTRRVSRAAIVPHMTPTLMSGAPMDTPGQLIVGASSVGHSTLAASDDTAAAEVVGTQFAGVLRGRLAPFLALGLIAERGLDRGARPLKATEAPVDAEGPSGRGVTMSIIVAAPESPWSFGLEIEAMLWTIPWVEYSTCVANCDGQPINQVTHGTDTVGQFAMGATPTYRSARWAAWGGVSLRNHPTVRQKGVEIGADLGGDVEGGTGNLVLSLGAEVELGAGFKASLIGYQVMGGAPATYGPSLAAMVTVPLGARQRR